MASRVATIKGVFLRPINSKNKRAYTKGNIADAVTRMQEKIASPDGWKLSMATSHGAAYNDDALSTIGRVTKVAQNPDGSASWEADIANTTAGRDIANLADGGYIKGVSIRGKWMSDPYSVKTDEGDMMTADKLDVFGIDFTGSPGVEGAQITDVMLMESTGDPLVFMESVEPVEVVFSEEVPTPKEMLAEATRLLSEASARLNAPTPDMVAEADKALAASMTHALEMYASVCFDNGAASISVSGSTDDAGKLAAVGDRLAIAAKAALLAVDPDVDGDIDITVNGKKDSSTESATEAVISPDDSMTDPAALMCISCGTAIPQNAMYCPNCGLPVPTAESNESAPSNKEALVADETTEASTETVEQESAAFSLSDADKKSIIEGIMSALKPEVTEAAAEEVVAETAPVVTEAKTYTAEEVAELVKAQVAEAVKDITTAVRQEAQEMVRSAGAGERKGLVESEGAATSVTEAAAPVDTKATLRKLATLTDSDRTAADHAIGEAFKADAFFGPLFERLDANARRQGF